MTLSAKGKLIHTTDGKYLLYIPAALHRDSAWPFPEGSQHVRITINTYLKRLMVDKLASEGKEKTLNKKEDEK